MVIDNQLENMVKLEFTINDLNIVIAALRELPHRVSDEVIRKIIAQAQKTSSLDMQTVD
jgi:hypothetical protein